MFFKKPSIEIMQQQYLDDAIRNRLYDILYAEATKDTYYPKNPEFAPKDMYSGGALSEYQIERLVNDYKTGKAPFKKISNTRKCKPKGTRDGVAGCKPRTRYNAALGICEEEDVDRSSDKYFYEGVKCDATIKDYKNLFKMLNAKKPIRPSDVKDEKMYRALFPSTMIDPVTRKRKRINKSRPISDRKKRINEVKKAIAAVRASNVPDSVKDNAISTLMSTIDLIKYTTTKRKKKTWTGKCKNKVEGLCWADFISHYGNAKIASPFWQQFKLDKIKPW